MCNQVEIITMILMIIMMVITIVIMITPLYISNHTNSVIVIVIFK